MGYSIIICQRADHLLIDDHVPGSIKFSTALSQHVGLATYDPAESGWLVDYVDALLERSQDGDVVLIADHDSIERYPTDPRVVRAEYAIGDTALSAAVHSMLKGETSAAETLLAWFWVKSRELPPAGIASLKGGLAKSGVAASLWAHARRVPHCRRALRWLALLAPDAVQADGFRLAVNLLANADPVPPDDHETVQGWLNAFQAPEAAVFLRYCSGDEGTGSP